MLKVAIVGCGRIFDKHMNSIVDLKNKFKLVSICDIDKKRLKEKSSNTEVNEYLDYNLMVFHPTTYDVSHLLLLLDYRTYLLHF